MPRKNDLAQLEEARRLLDVLSKDERLQAELEPFGYGEAKRREGYQLLAAAIEARNTAHIARSHKLSATAAFHHQRSQIEQMVSALVHIVRATYEADDPVLITMGLQRRARRSDGSRPPEPTDSNSRFASYARSLYDGALAREDVLQRLAQVGYPVERLQRERAELPLFWETSAQQVAQAAEAKARTADYRAAMARLEQWVRLLRAIARSQLRRRPDLLAALGI